MQFKSFKLDTTYTYPPTVTTVYIKSRNYISLYTIWKAPLISLRMWQHVFFFCFCGIRCINTHAPTHHSLHWAAAQLPSFIPRCNGQKHHIDSELKVASSSRRWHVFFHPVDGFNLNILSTIVFGWLWMSLDDFGWSKMLSISFGMAWNHQTVFFFCAGSSQRGGIDQTLHCFSNCLRRLARNHPMSIQMCRSVLAALLMLPHQWTGQKSSKDL